MMTEMIPEIGFFQQPEMANGSRGFY